MEGVSKTDKPTINSTKKEMTKYCRNNNIEGFSKFTNKKSLLIFIKTQPLIKLTNFAKKFESLEIEKLKNFCRKNNIKGFRNLKTIKSLLFLIKREPLRKLEIVNRRALNRYSDLKYYLSLYLSSIININNPVFEDRDLEKKKEIFGIPDNNTCIINKTTNGVGVGDHLFEINGYYIHTGYRGVDDDWNKLPVSTDLNTSYKIFEFIMDGKTIKKNIGYETLTDEEYNCLKQSNNSEYSKYIDLYDKINLWKDYVSSRNAQIYYKEPNGYEEICNKLKERHYNNVRYLFRCIRYMCENQTIENRFINIYNKIISKRIIDCIKHVYHIIELNK